MKGGVFIFSLYKSLFLKKKSRIQMKNPIEGAFFRILASAFLPVAFAFLLSACESDSTEADTTKNLIGTWHQSSRAIDGISAVKDSTRLLIQINSDNICVLCDSSAASVKTKTIVKRSGWSYNSGLFNLAIDMPASWIAKPDATTLTLERSDFKSDGTILKTVLTYTRVASIEIK